MSITVFIGTLPRLVDVKCRVNSPEDSANIDELSQVQTNCTLQLQVSRVPPVIAFLGLAYCMTFMSHIARRNFNVSYNWIYRMLN